MKKKSVLSVLLALVMVLSVTAAPAMAATKTSTKTITFDAGTYYEEESLDSDIAIKVTNVTSQKTKDYSVDLKDDEGNTNTYEGKKSKVIYCKAKTTITLKTSGAFGIGLCSDTKTTKSVKSNFKYYGFSPETEEVDTSKKYDEAPEGGWVLADGSTYTLTKAGTYVLYVRPYQFYGRESEGDFTLNPVFIVVK